MAVLIKSGAVNFLKSKSTIVAYSLDNLKEDKPAPAVRDIFIDTEG